MTNDKKFKVNVIETERGWGSKIDEVKLFSTQQEANTFIKDFNAVNNQDTVPDWYMYAEAANY